MTRAIIFAAALLVASCKKEEPAAPTAQQSDQLNEAEQMLNTMARNEEGPEQSPGPSNSSD